MHFLVLLTALLALQRTSAQANAAHVEIRTFQFAPDTLRISLGAKVQWTNQDEIEHSVSAGTPTARDAAFNAVLSSKGKTAERTFNQSGTFTYFCDRHQFMRGAITITR